MALSTLPVITSPGGYPTEVKPVILVDPAGAYAGGGGGSGGGDASAANQVTGNATLAAILEALGVALPLPSGAATESGQSTANATLAAIVTALAGLLGVVPQMASGGHLAVATAAGGTAFTAFASQACKQLTIINNTGTTLEVQRGGGIAVPVFPTTYFTFFGLANASQLGVRRVDQAAVSVTAHAVWEA